MVHKLDERSDALRSLGVEVVAGDMTDFDSVSAAMKDITSVFFVYPVKAGLLEATAYFAQAALEENVSHFVNISQRTSLRNAPSKSAQEHWLAEALLDRSGVPVTHLQPTLFMEWLAYFAQEVKDNNRLISPFGDASYGMINAEDIGRVGAAVIANPEDHIGKTYQLYGPREITGPEITAALSEALKRDISYMPLSPEVVGDIIGSSNSPFNNPYTIKHIIAIGHMFPTGDFRGMNNNVELLSGHKPSSISQFITQNIEMFQ
jgi:uncharacterized protein YbjT (DUF2867 family)